MKRFLNSDRNSKVAKLPNSPTSKITKTQEACTPPHPTPIYMFSETRKQTTGNQKNVKDQKSLGCGRAMGWYKGSHPYPGRTDQDASTLQVDPA